MFTLLIRILKVHFLILSLLMSSNAVLSQSNNNLSSGKIFQAEENVELKQKIYQLNKVVRQKFGCGVHVICALGVVAGVGSCFGNRSGYKERFRVAKLFITIARNGFCFPRHHKPRNCMMTLST